MLGPMRGVIDRGTQKEQIINLTDKQLYLEEMLRAREGPLSKSGMISHFSTTVIKSLYN
jgi:hypothetical protein